MCVCAACIKRMLELINVYGGRDNLLMDKYLQFLNT